MTRQLKTFLIAGVIVPAGLHVLSPKAMPWWPDTASLAVVFGVTAVLAVSRYEQDRDLNRRIGTALAQLARRVLPRVTYEPARPSKQASPPRVPEARRPRS